MIDAAKGSREARLLARLPVYAAATVVLAMAASLLLRGGGLGLFYLQQQDRWLILFGALSISLLCMQKGNREAEFSGTWRLVLGVGLAMALATLVGHFLILSGYDLSADEQRANFDAAVFAHGQFAAPLPTQWQNHSAALNPMFMFPAEHREAWISIYLPGNAILRALVGMVASPAFTGPLLTFAGALALWGCVRRLWPDNREAPVVAMMLYAGSGQVWLNGMSSYAMPAHLTFNLCWLWLFLQRRWWADGLALLVGFFAVGLHQLHYHPLFAAPILFLLVLERDWRRAAFFAVGYLAIGLFWQSWSLWSATLVVGGPLTAHSQDASYLGRLLINLGVIDGTRIPNMTANLFRLVAWQHLLLIPLVLLGLGAVKRNRLAAALLAGIVLTLLARFAFQPFQGHGLGYRYTHGLTGNFILLALCGWMAIKEDVARWRWLLLRTTAASCLILLPLQAWMAHRFYDSFSIVSERIDASRGDYAVVGGRDAPYAIDLVFNAPYLDNRPIRLIREKLDEPLQSQICASRPTVVVVGSNAMKPIAEYFRDEVAPAAEANNRKIAASLRAQGCRVEYL